MIERLSNDFIRFNGKISPLDYCKLPYPKHPDGCPNVDSKRSLDGHPDYLKPWIIRECPSKNEEENILFDKIFDLNRPVFLIITEYPVGKDAEYLRTHSDKLTTIPQIYNVRYWQDRARKILNEEVSSFLLRDSSKEIRANFHEMDFSEIKEQTIVDLCPEAHGLKIVSAASGLGINVRFGIWPPEKHNPEMVLHQVAIGGYPNDPELLLKRGSLGRIK